MAFRVSNKALITEDGRALIVRRANCAHAEGVWEFPGGKMEFGETIEAALAREVREETGLAVEILRLLYAATVPLPEEGRQIVFLYHLCRPASLEVSLSAEHSAFRWALPGELAPLIKPEIYADLRRYGALALPEFHL